MSNVLRAYQLLDRTFKGRAYDHAMRVAILARVWELPSIAIAAALVHDVLEDTPLTEYDLSDAGLDPEVVEIVVGLTDRYTPDAYPDQGRWGRKLWERTRLSREPTITRILKLIDQGKLEDSVKSTASKVFHRLAQAEATVHGSDPQEVHFQEVGAVESIVKVYDLVKLLPAMSFATTLIT